MLNNSRVPGIDIDIQIAFRHEYLNLILPHLKDLGFTSILFDEMIDAYIASGEKVSYERWIMEYGQAVINPLLNERLKRKPEHPTFNNLLRYALKEHIENDQVIMELKKFKSVV